jgi:hypothetical protein
LLHGLGFANTIRMIMAESQHIAVPLLSFNIGLEIGQICFVLLLLLLAHFFIKIIGFNIKNPTEISAGFSFLVFGLFKNDIVYDK